MKKRVVLSSRPEMDKKYSYLWNFFVISDADAGKAVCYLCNHTLSYKTTITNLKKHLQSRHPEIQIQSSSVVIHQDIADLLSKNAEALDLQCEIVGKPGNSEQKKRKSNQESSIVKLKKVEPPVERSIVKLKKVYPPPEKPVIQSISSASKKSIDNKLINFIVKGFHRLSTVADPGFFSFVFALNPQYEIPNLVKLSKVMLPQLVEQIKQNAEDAIQDGFSVTLTVDSWTSSHHEQIISVKAHFLNQNFEPMTVLLDCYSFSEQPTNEKLHDVLKNIISKWNIGNKINVIISNTTFEQTRDQQLQWEYMNCVIHTINVIAASSLELISSLLLKVQCIVSCYQQNPVASFKLQRNQENLGNVPLELILSNTTDWYSVFSMLQRFVEMEDYIKPTLSHLDVSMAFLDKDEWLICKEVVEVIKPFEVFIKSLDEEKYITSSLAIILAKGLETMLRDLSERPFHDVTQSVLCKCIEETVSQFSFLYTSNVLLISTFLDPRFKDVIFEPNVQEELKQSIFSILSTTSVGAKDSPAKKPEGSSLGGESLSIWKAFQSKASEVRTSTSSWDTRVSMEIQQYIDDGLLPRGQNPLQWWKCNGHMFPHLMGLMKRNVAMTCSSVPGNLYFSKDAQVLHERRSFLTVEEAKLILFIHFNSSLITLND